jgi:ATP-dependent RNA helicase DeaD
MDRTTADEAGFDDLGLPAEVVRALTELGYEEPTPIQRAAIPPLLAGHDVVGQAATGTGKTAAFALPVLAGLESQRTAVEPAALVLVPTRELAMQVSEAFHRYGRHLGTRVLPVYGGQPIGRQLERLRRGVDVVVATPGRAVDHLSRGTLSLRSLSTVVLDEADEMLDMGFAEDLESILAATPPGRQTVLFSATLPARIAGLVSRHLQDPVRVEIQRDPGRGGTTPQVGQRCYVVPRAHKAAALGRILDVESPTAAIVFCRTRHEVDELTESLNGRGYRAEALHGGMSQEQRDRVMARLRSGTADLLVATDVAARGLDVDTLTHVVNYDVPSAPESYVHRIGRVGRAGREGVAITLAAPRERRLVQNIERLTGQRIPVETVPTVAELRSKRLDTTVATIRECLASEEIAEFRDIAEALAEEFDLMDVALAAIKLAHDVNAPDAGEQEIPQAKERAAPGRAGRGESRGDNETRPARRRDKPASDGMTKIFVAAGREAGIRPQDLVGAIAGETRLEGRQIGAIEIAERFSLVQIPDSSVDEVLWALRRTTIKGRRVKVRRERPDR